MVFILICFYYIHKLQNEDIIGSTKINRLLCRLLIQIYSVNKSEPDDIKFGEKLLFIEGTL